MGLLPSNLAHAACDFDDFPVLDEMVVASIAEQLQWNNQPMNVKAFSLDGPLSTVLAFYSEQWQGAVDVTRFGEWQQVLHISEACLMLVQVQAHQGKSTGRLMLVNPPAEALATRALGSGVPMPPDAVVVSDMQTDDAGREGQLVMLASTESLEDNLRWYQSEMLRGGWQANHVAQQQNDATLIYSKGRKQFAVVLLRHEGFTQILLNRMEQ
ncbi:hypothetical protein SAMN05216600_104207 [Pseudomonas cuatrocienegasensis]|uniref:Uncharacterized protein n=1 Tax=Pseudomonas cuatrocienegasensis TaxID=543360 RepID=A0ABY1B8Z2_9PSED|nr:MULTISPECIES: hypothetical protein [Pseudomonas]OEC35699.1 hypothetical protein A7D25_07710 [Pseudomonas sp. 21C1]SEQ24322.1 hypothetical protein SAMN05216600_104207 [Pseudomonas cuatrocienegasensis]